MWGRGAFCPIASKAELYLGVYDKYQCSCSPEDHLVVKRRVKKVDLSWEVPNLEINKGAVGHVFPADLVGALQEQRLVGGHFVKDHFLNRRLATSSQTHEQDPRLHLSAEGITEVQNWRKPQNKNEGEMLSQWLIQGVSLPPEM